MRLILLLLMLAGPAFACPAPPNLAATQMALIQAINAERRTRGLTLLIHSPALAKAAQSLACDNAARRTVSHSGADGSTLASRLAAQGFRFAAAAENAAAGYPDPVAVTKGWMTSPAHRRYILNPALRQIGAGVAAAGDGQLHWVIDLGTPG